MAAFTDLRKTSVVAGSVHGTNDYLRWVGRSTEERAEQRKAARLCLDTSAHAGSEFQQLVSVLSNVSHNAPQQCALQAVGLAATSHRRLTHRLHKKLPLVLAGKPSEHDSRSEGPCVITTRHV